MTATKKAGKPLEAFRATHDKSFVIPNKIQAGIDQIGKDGWEYEADFVKICGVSIVDFGKFREQFSDYYVPLDGSRSGKRAWAGSKQLADKMRSMV